MREIKFRGKSEHTGEWVYGFGVGKNENGVWIQNKIDDYSFVCENTIGQFTGIHDKKGNEIYEGDKTNFGVVSFHKGNYVVGNTDDYCKWYTLTFAHYKGIEVLND